MIQQNEEGCDWQRKLDEAREENLALIEQQKILREKFKRIQEEPKSDFQSQMLEELRSQLQVKDQELFEMKDSLVKGLREARELKQYYQSLIDEKSAVLQKNSQIQRVLEESKTELKRKDGEIEALRHESAAAKAQNQELQRQLDQEKREKKEREDNIISLSEQIRTARGQLIELQTRSQEKDDGVIEAKQHLAKKVRETSQLAEKLEERNERVRQLEEEVNSLKAKEKEMKAHLESQEQHQLKYHEKISELEGKYFQIKEKLQEVEGENRELKKIEEKHTQLQELLSNLGTAIGKPIGLTQPFDVVQTKKAPKKKPQVVQEQTLFDCDPELKKYKDDLFE